MCSLKLLVMMGRCMFVLVDGLVSVFSLVGIFFLCNILSDFVVLVGL